MKIIKGGKTIVDTGGVIPDFKEPSRQVDEIVMSDREMPKYKCHKEVHALKIGKIILNETDGSAMITPVEEGYSPFKVSQPYTRKYNLQVGGYYVVYEDGYKSFSPAEAFESGYTKI